jgi:hypothetical protein
LLYACVRRGQSHEGRFGEGRAILENGSTLEGKKSQEGYALLSGLNRPAEVADFRVEQNPGVEGCSAGLTTYGAVGLAPVSAARQENAS